jgi:hypothetical protein
MVAAAPHANEMKSSKHESTDSKQEPHSGKEIFKMAFRPGYEAGNQEQWVRRALDKTYKYDVLANDRIVLNATSSESTAGDIAAMVEHLGAQGRLEVNPEWRQPFDEFFARSPRFVNSLANRGILEQAWAASGRMLTADDIELVAYNPDVVGQLAETHQYVDQQRSQQAAAARAERERIESEQIRAEMLGWLVDGPRKEMLDKSGAPRIVFQKEVRDETNRLTAMSHAELVAEVTRRREVRRIKGLGAKEYRAEVAISRAAGEQPVAQQKMAQAMQQHTPGPTYTTRDGVTFALTRANLIAAANRNPALFREIVRVRGAEFVNDVLAGRV